MKIAKQTVRTARKTERRAFNPFLLSGHRILGFRGQSAQIVSKVGDMVIVRDGPRKSFSNFELAEQIAKNCRKNQRPITDATRRWIEVPEWTDERERQEIQTFLRPNDDPWGPQRLGCRALLCGSPSAVSALGTMARECLDQLQVTADSIGESELYSAQASIAAEKLARVIGEACSKMNTLARKHPRIFHRFSRKNYWKWPVMKSTYPEFGEDDISLLRGLQLGKDLPLRLDPKAQWARWINDEVGQISWSLLWYVWRTRSENNRWGFDYGNFSKMAEALPPLDKNSAPKWWEVAKEALLYSYPKPLKVAELAALVKGRKERRYPSRLEEAILDKLKKRFLSLTRLPLTSPT